MGSKVRLTLYLESKNLNTTFMYISRLSPNSASHFLTDFKEKVSEATDGDKVSKLTKHCARVEHDKR